MEKKFRTHIKGLNQVKKKSPTHKFQIERRASKIIFQNEFEKKRFRSPVSPPPPL